MSAQPARQPILAWAYLVLLNEELCLRSPAKSQLDSPEARRVFMLPATE